MNFFKKTTTKIAISHLYVQFWLAKDIKLLPKIHRLTKDYYAEYLEKCCSKYDNEYAFDFKSSLCCIIIMETLFLRPWFLRCIENVSFFWGKLFHKSRCSTLGICQVSTDKFLSNYENIEFAASYIDRCSKEVRLLIPSATINQELYMIGFLYNATHHYAWTFVNLYNYVNSGTYVSERDQVYEITPFTRCRLYYENDGTISLETLEKYANCCDVASLIKRAKFLNEELTVEDIRNIFFRVNSIIAEDSLRFDLSKPFPYNWPRRRTFPFTTGGELFYSCLPKVILKHFPSLRLATTDPLVLLCREAKSAYIVDNVTGRVLLHKNINHKLPVASLQKIATALLTVANCNLDDEVEVSEDMLQELKHLRNEDAQMFIYKLGDKVHVQDLIETMLVASDSAAAYLLANKIAQGSDQKFVEMLNSFVLQCGASSTHFTSPHGVYEAKEDLPFSTAKDIMLLFQLAMANPLLKKFMTQDYCVSPCDASQKGNYKCLLNEQHNLFRPYVTAYKTGTTDIAGSCIALRAEHNQKSIDVIVLGVPYTVGQTFQPALYPLLVNALDKILEYTQ